MWGEIMQTDTMRQITDEQAAAIQFLLAVADGCGLDKLSLAELVALCQRLGAALDEAERAAYNRGVADVEEFQLAVIASRQLKRAH